MSKIDQILPLIQKHGPEIVDYIHEHGEMITQNVDDRSAKTEQELNALRLKLFYFMKGKGENYDFKDDGSKDFDAFISALKNDSSFVQTLKGIDGHTPTNEELTNLITPLIPEPLKHSDDEITELIKPLIPKPIDGHTPTNEELVSLFKPLIPEIPTFESETSKSIVDKINIGSALIKKEIIDVDWLRFEPKKDKEYTIDDIKGLPDAIKKLKYSHAKSSQPYDQVAGGGGSGGTGSSISLRTNGTTNGSQSILNLKQGTNVTIADDGVGGITINATASGTGTVTSVTGVLNRTTITGTPTVAPVVDIASTYVGQASITTLGTIATGVWNGSAIGDTYISSSSTWNAKQNALSGTGFVKSTAGVITYDTSTYLTSISGQDHNTLANLTVGDVHTQYALLAGRTGGQTIIGGTGASNNLTLLSTSNATKGKIIFGALGTSVYDAVNDRWGFGTANPSATIQSVATTGAQFASGQSDTIKWTATTASTTGITTLNATGGTLPSFWMSSQTVIGNAQTVLTDPRTVIIGQIKDRTYTQMNQGVLQVTAPAHSISANAFDKNMGIFFDIDNSTIYNSGTGVIQFYLALNTGGPLAINPNGGGVSINTTLASPIDNTLGLLVGGNASNNAFIKVRNNTSFGGGTYNYSGYLFQQANGTTYVKAGIIYDAYDGTGGGYGRGRMLFCVNGVLDGSNVQDTVVASTRMNIDYVAGVVTIGQGVTTGTGKLNVMSTTEQLRLYNDASNYLSTTVGSTGAVTFDAVGAGASFNFLDTVQAPNIGIGIAPSGTTGLLIGGTGYTSNLIAATGSLSPTAGTNATLYRIAGTIVEASSGTHNLMSAMFIGQTTVTSGLATVNNTASLYIEDAMTATVSGVNYALWVDNGISRLDGNAIFGGTVSITPLSTNGLVKTSGGTGLLSVATAGSDYALPFIWTEVITTSQTAVVNAGYIASNVALVTVTIPTTAVVGSIIRIVGKGAGGWKVAQNASQSIIWNEGGVAGVDVTTVGTGGSLASTDDYDTVEIMCITANTGWVIINSKGNITLT